MSLWTKIFGEPDDWRFVGRFVYGYKNNEGYEGAPWTKQELTYYLYENQHGERKFDVIDSLKDRGDLRVKSLSKNDWVFRNKGFRSKIRPWLDGLRDPEYPTYETAPNHDFARLLKGKV